jgi:predicted ATPase
MQQGLDGWSRIGAQITTPYYLTLLADACAAVGEAARAQEALARALELADRHYERWWLAEQYRLQGVLLNGSPSAGAATGPDAIGWLTKAADHARAQQSLALELRALTSLVDAQPEPDRAATRQRLRQVVQRVTEGLDTADVRRAVALLELRV